MWLNNLFSGIFETTASSNFALSSFLLCIGVSLLIGLFVAVTYTYKTKYTKSFVVTLAMLPSIVCVVIMMVNGNVGMGVAVAGTFSLVRFRSVPGTAKEIGAIFLAMGAGLICGTGYLGYAILFSLIVSLATIAYNMSNVGNAKSTQKTLRVTIPETLDYTDIFDDLFKKYTIEHELMSVRTTNMGSLFKLTYDITLNSINLEKTFLDDLRCRNGNLEITLSKQASFVGEL